jgi:hypothetical protein
MWNPVRTVWHSNSPRGIKIIALSLMLVLVCALPIMLFTYLGGENSNPVVSSWIFAIGAMLGHIGFFIGVILLIWETYFAKK